MPEACFQHDVTAANNCSLGYSAANRLTTSYFAPWGQNTYTYDGVGNRKTDVYTNPSSVVTNRTYTYTSSTTSWRSQASLGRSPEPSDQDDGFHQGQRLGRAVAASLGVLTSASTRRRVVPMIVNRPA
jgi:hypothetical protein